MLLVILWILPAACGNGAGTQSGTAETGDREMSKSTTATTNTTTEPPMRISCECASGPRPPPVGRSAVESWRVELVTRAELTRTIKYAGASERTSRSTVDAATSARVFKLAGAALERPKPTSEQPVPDGTICRLEIGDASRTLDVRLTMPTQNSDLRPLLDELIRLLPNPDMRITDAEAIAAARTAITSSITVPTSTPIEILHQSTIIVVTFRTALPPGTRGADYHARVKVDGMTGKVTEMLAGS